VRSGAVPQLYFASTSSGLVQYNLRTPDVQGEIDVIGICLATRTVYAREVAVHIVTGLQYVKDNRPDNVARLVAKFRKDIQYIRHAFPDYKHEFMFWSPVVKNQRTGAKYNQTGDVQKIIATIFSELGVTIQPVINEKFREALDTLRQVAASETKKLGSTVMRLLQVEEHLAKHLKQLRPTDSAQSAMPQSDGRWGEVVERLHVPERVR
jgi:hypothetical protein